MEQYLRAFVFEQKDGYKLKKVVWVLDLTGTLTSPYGYKSKWGIPSGYGYIYVICLSHKITKDQVTALIANHSFKELQGKTYTHYWLDFGDSIRDWRIKFSELIDIR